MTVQMEIKLQQTMDPTEAFTILTLGTWSDLTGLTVNMIAAAHERDRERRIN